MKQQMTDPYTGMVSFQELILTGTLTLGPVKGHDDLYSYADMPEPGERRLTYVRLDKNRKTIKAFLSCIVNGMVDGNLCVAVGYAVPESLRGKGFAKNILRDVIHDLRFQALNNGRKGVAVEAVIDERNLASRKVAEAVMNVKPEQIIDSLSQTPAVRYTAVFNNSTL